MYFTTSHCLLCLHFTLSVYLRAQEGKTLSRKVKISEIVPLLFVLTEHRTKASVFFSRKLTDAGAFELPLFCYLRKIIDPEQSPNYHSYTVPGCMQAARPEGDWDIVRMAVSPQLQVHVSVVCSVCDCKPHKDNTASFCHSTGSVVSSYMKKSVSLCCCKHILAHLAELRVLLCSLQRCLGTQPSSSSKWFSIKWGKPWFVVGSAISEQGLSILSS